MKNNLNLFWREPISSKIERVREKENNVTHAFLVTLAKDKKMASKLIKKLDEKLADVSLGNDFEIDLQVDESRKRETVAKKKQILLFINSKYNVSEAMEEDDKKQKSIPDGLILNKNLAILIEAKVNDSKSDQIKRYNNTFFSGSGDEIYSTWEQIYCEMTRIESKDFVIPEFLRYLEVIGLSGFRGISFFRKDFEYNKTEAEGITKELCNELEEWFNKKHTDLVVGKRPKAGAWDYVYLKKLETNNKKPDAQSIPHIGFGFDYEAFNVMVTFNKKTVLNKILKSEWKQFFENITKFSEDKNTYLMGSHYKMLAHKTEYKHHRQGEKYSDFKIQLQLSRINKNSEEYFKNLLNFMSKERLKEIAIVKKFYYKDSFDTEITKFADGEKALKKIKLTINELKPYYKFIVKISEK